MKTILCYGDSNTWGYNPHTDERYSMEERWPGALRSALGEGYWVIEEGLNGRTTVWDDPVAECRSGKIYLGPCLQTHKPLDLVVMLLGTNDLKPRFSLNAYDIGRGIQTLVEIIKKSEAGPANAAPQVLVVSPPIALELEGTDKWEDEFAGAEEKSKQLAKHYAEVARLFGCHFMDAAEVVVSSPCDGIHLEAEEHKKLGQAVAEKVKEKFR